MKNSSNKLIEFLNTDKSFQFFSTKIEEELTLGRKKVIAGKWYFRDLKDYEESINDKKSFLISNKINDEKDLKDDYIYIQNLLNVYSQNIGKYLNKFHNVEFDQRYWDIIILPWLITYLPTQLYRWRIVNKAIYEDRQLIFSDLDQEEIIPNTTLDYLNLIRENNQFNHQVFKRILNYLKVNENKKIKFIKSKKKSDNKKIKKKKLTKINLLFYKFLELISIIVSKKNLIYIDDHLFRKKILLQLNFNFKQFPAFLFFKNYENLIISDSNHSNKKREKIDNLNCRELNKKDLFTNYLDQVIKFDIPRCFLENYKVLNKSVETIKYKPKIIISAYHYHNERFKLWIAKNVKDCKTLFFPSSHGGGNQLMFSACYQFEKKICDKKIVWTKPRESNDIQLPSSKFIGFKNNRSKKIFITYVEMPSTKYPLRINGDEHQSYFKNLKNIEYVKKYLKEEFFHQFICLRSGGENILERKKVIKLLGKKYIDKKLSLHKYLDKSKILICAYPETAFLEGLISGPTILINNFTRMPLNDSSNNIHKKLIDCKISFESIHEAVLHLNRVAYDPYIWWNSKEVQNTVFEFKQRFCKIENKPVNSWKNFIREELKKII